MTGGRRSNTGFRMTAGLAVMALIGSLLIAVLPATPSRAQDDPAFPPGDYPRAVSIGDQQFLFDRLVPIVSDALTQVGEDAGATLFADGDAGPFDRVFGVTETGEEGEAGRYLAVQLGDEAPACLVADDAFTVLTAGDTTYAYAGLEPDLVTDDLIELGSADLGDGTQRSLYGDTDQPPFNEFFVPDDDGELFRFVALDGDVPQVLSGDIPIGEQSFTVSGNVADQVDRDSLLTLGCVGPFPLLADQDVTAPYETLYAAVGDRVLALAAQEVEEPASPSATSEDEGTPEEQPTAETEVTPVLPLPEDLPTEITVEDASFLFDRAVPLDRGDLERIGRDGSLLFYARTDTAPFDAVYVSAPPRSDTALGRYLPEHIGEPEPTCPADASSQATIEINDVGYVFAGYEGDLTTDNLVAIDLDGTTETYAETDDPDSSEIFVPDANGLGRYLRLGDDGRPQTLEGDLTFGGQQFSFVGDASGSVDPSTLARVGCAGPFSLLGDAAQLEPPFGNLYLQVGGVLLEWAPLGGISSPEASPTEEAPATETAVPTETETPTEVPTDTPEATETEVPTETPVPTETAIPTEEPTEESAPTETIVPAEEATATPTEVTPTETTEPEAPTATTAPEEPTATLEPPAPTPTRQLQPPAVIPTLAPNIPPPPAATAVSSACVGDAGAPDVNGLPERLPRRIQYRGTAYSFADAVDADDAGSLTRLGCAGPFTVFSTDQAPIGERLYLRDGSDSSGPLFRFDAAKTFTVQVEVTGQPRVVRTEDADYELIGRYQRSIYSSVTAILFVEDPAATEPDLIYALRVDADVIGRYEPESDDLQEPTDAVAAAAQRAYINPDLELNGKRYVLTAVLTPQGTTTNGFVTLYAIPDQEVAEFYLGVDPRTLDLLIFRRVGGG